MPSARMTKTVCVAAMSPKPDQIDAIHIQRWACELLRLISITDRSPQLGREGKDAANQRKRAATGLALNLVSNRYFRHAHDTQDDSAARKSSCYAGGPGAGDDRSTIYQ